MNLSEHAKGITNPEWIDNAIATMGEDQFWEYVGKVYGLLDKIEVGQSVPIEQWVKAENLDLFIKIATCYVSTSQCCYQFNPEYTIIKRQFNAREVEKTLALLRHTRRTKIAEGNVGGTENPSGGVEIIFAQEPAI